MRPLIFTKGQRFNALTVTESCGKSERGANLWLCLCDCGNTTTVDSSSLKSGKVKSCGCLKLAGHNRKHGRSFTSTYNSWASMKQRCFNPNHPSFKHYGGRGIVVCDRWLSFENFISDMGERPENTTLERKENSKGYCPDNCVWATNEAQSNNRRTNRVISHNGETKTLAQWARVVGIPSGAILYRLNSGWSVERALSEPVDTAGGQFKARDSCGRV